MSIFTTDDTARYYPDEWKAITDGGYQRCVEYSTVPDEPPPDDGEDQGGDQVRGLEGRDTLALCIKALTKAQRGAFGDGATIGEIHVALAACHADRAALDRIKARVMAELAREERCAHCGGAHSIQRCHALLEGASIPHNHTDECVSTCVAIAEPSPVTMPPYAALAA